MLGSFLDQKLVSIAKTYFFAPLVSSPYRIVTNLYTIKIEFYQLFFKTFILYGWAIDFNFLRGRPYWISIYLLFPQNRPPMRTSFSTNIDWHIDAVSNDVIIWKGMKRMVWERPQDDTRGAQMSPFAIWKQGMTKKRSVKVLEEKSLWSKKGQ